MEAGTGSDLPKILFRQIVKPSTDWWRFYKENNHVEGQVTQLANITGVLEALRAVAGSLGTSPEELLGANNDLLYVAKLTGGNTQPTVAGLLEYFQKHLNQAQQDLRALKEGGGAGTGTCMLPTCLTDDSALSRIIGQTEAVKDIKTGFMFPLMHESLFPTMAKGILLYGPPGTGKTALARAAVNDLVRESGAHVHFFLANPADLKGKYLGESEKQIRQLFDCAQAAATASLQEGLAKNSRVMLTVDGKRQAFIVQEEADGVYLLTQIKELPKSVKYALNPAFQEAVKDAEDEVVYWDEKPFWVTGGNEKVYQSVLRLRPEEIFGAKYRGVSDTRSLSVIFVDEVDSVAGTREGDASGLRATTVNALLQEMDGVAAKPNVVVMAATNYPWRLDEAFLRRMTKQIRMTIPDSNAIKTKFEQMFLDHRKAVLRKILAEPPKPTERKKRCDDIPKNPPVLEEWTYKNDDEERAVTVMSELMQNKYTLDDVEKVVREAARLAGDDALLKGSFLRLNLSRMSDEKKAQYAWLSAVLQEGEDVYVPTMNQDDPATALKNLFSGDVLLHGAPETFAICLAKDEEGSCYVGTKGCKTKKTWFVTDSMLPSFLKPTGFITQVYADVCSYVEHALSSSKSIEFLVQIDLLVEGQDQGKQNEANTLLALLNGNVTENDLKAAKTYNKMLEKTGKTIEDFEAILKKAKTTPNVPRSVYLKGAVSSGKASTSLGWFWPSLRALGFYYADDPSPDYLGNVEKTMEPTEEQKTQVNFVNNATEIYVPWMQLNAQSVVGNTITEDQKKALKIAIMNDGILRTTAHPLSQESMSTLVTGNMQTMEENTKPFQMVQKDSETPLNKETSKQAKERKKREQDAYIKVIERVLGVLDDCDDRVCGPKDQRVPVKKLTESIVDEERFRNIAQRGLIIPHIDVTWIEKVLDNPAMAGNVNPEKVRQVNEYHENPAAYIEKVRGK